MATAKLVLDLKNVEYEIERMDEDTPIRGNCIASGDDDADREAERAVERELEHNEWAWCCVRVTAKLGPFKGTDYLGSVSASSEQDFCQNSGYYDDMRAQALAHLIDNLKQAGAQIEE